MGDTPKLIPEEEHESIKDNGEGIGQLADGTIDTFDPSEWPKRKADYEMSQAAFEGALREVFGDDGDESFEDDLSDLDDDYDF